MSSKIRFQLKSMIDASSMEEIFKWEAISEGELIRYMQWLINILTWISAMNFACRIYMNFLGNPTLINFYMSTLFNLFENCYSLLMTYICLIEIRQSRYHKTMIPWIDEQDRMLVSWKFSYNNTVDIAHFWFWETFEILHYYICSNFYFTILKIHIFFNWISL